ncbi:hypothetical protein PINS_up000352 [Pythium insidiosum]|nr:hypothetical protein PINS_up000352 [Pythium insidiosum]
MTTSRVKDPSGRPLKSRVEYEVKLAACTRERAKHYAILQEENNNGKEYVTAKYTIDAGALIAIYERLGCPLPNPKAQIEEMIWEINDNLDGVISFDEFERSYLRARSDRTGLEPSELFFLTCFLMFDKDCSGKVRRFIDGKLGRHV